MSNLKVVTHFLYKTKILYNSTTYSNSLADFLPSTSPTLMALSPYKDIQINTHEIVVIVYIHIISLKIRQLACKEK